MTSALFLPVPIPKIISMAASKGTDESVSTKDIPLFIIAGPAGCGKTTIASALAENAQFAFIEGDTLHPPENIKKMSAGCLSLMRTAGDGSTKRFWYREKLRSRDHL